MCCVSNWVENILFDIYLKNCTMYISQTPNVPVLPGLVLAVGFPG